MLLTLNLWGDKKVLEDIIALDKSIFLVINNGFSSPFFDMIMIIFSWFGSGYVLAGLIGLGLYIFDRDKLTPTKSI